MSTRASRFMHLFTSVPRPKLLVCVAGLSGVATALFYMVVLSEIHCVDGWFPSVFIDFRNTWFGAVTALGGDLRVLFDRTAYNKARSIYFPGESGHIWSYPLHIIPLALPFGLLSFPQAALLWTALNLSVYGWFLRRTADDRDAVALVIVSSGFVATFMFGQFTFLAAILLVGGLRILPTRPILAGAAFGTLTLKPHFGILLPLFLLLDRRWSAIGAATITATGLILLSVAILGVEPWRLYLDYAVSTQAAEMVDNAKLWPWEPSLYAGLRIVGVERTAALAGQGLVTVACAGTLIGLRITGSPQRTRAELLPLLTLASLPYVLPADLLLIAPLLAMRLVRPPQMSFLVQAAVLLVLLGASIGFVLAALLHLPLLPLAMELTVVLLVKEAWQARPTPAPTKERSLPAVAVHVR